VLKEITTRFSKLKLWQKALVIFVLFSIAVSPFTGSQSNQADGGNPSPSSSASEQPQETSTPTPRPLLFDVPAWVNSETAQQYSDAFEAIPDQTNMDVQKFISIDFTDFDDGTYGVFIDIAASENFSVKSACGVAFRESQDLFASIMSTVNYDFGDYKLDVLRIFSKLEGTDDFGNAKWYLLKQTGMERSNFSKIEWGVPDIQDGVNWDNLGSGPSCDTYE